MSGVVAVWHQRYETFTVRKCVAMVTASVEQPPARGPDRAHEGLASGQPPCSAITLQSGARNPSPKNAGFTSGVMSVLVKVPQLESPPVQGSARFQALVDEVDVQYGDLLYFCEVRWLCRGTIGLYRDVWIAAIA